MLTSNPIVVVGTLWFAFKGPPLIRSFIYAALPIVFVCIYLFTTEFRTLDFTVYSARIDACKGWYNCEKTVLIGLPIKTIFPYFRPEWIVSTIWVLLFSTFYFISGILTSTLTGASKRVSSVSITFFGILSLSLVYTFTFLLATAQALLLFYIALVVLYSGPRLKITRFFVASFLLAVSAYLHVTFILAASILVLVLIAPRSILFYLVSSKLVLIAIASVSLILSNYIALVLELVFGSWTKVSYYQNVNTFGAVSLYLCVINFFILGILGSRLKKFVFHTKKISVFIALYAISLAFTCAGVMFIDLSSIISFRFWILADIFSLPIVFDFLRTWLPKHSNRAYLILGVKSAIFVVFFASVNWRF